MGTLERINELEKNMLSCLEYKIKVSSSEYAKYYFLLRSMLQRSGLSGEDLENLKPLDVENARRLEQCSARYQMQYRQNLVSSDKNNICTKKPILLDRRVKSLSGQFIGGGLGRRSLNLEQVVQM